MGCKPVTVRLRKRRTPFESGRASARGRRNGHWALATGALIIIGFATGAIALSTGQTGDEPERVGVCHATNSSERPYVFLVLNAHGVAFGHHVNHEDDIVGASSLEDCHELADVSAPHDESDAQSQGPDVALDAKPIANGTLLGVSFVLANEGTVDAQDVELTALLAPVDGPWMVSEAPGSCSLQDVELACEVGTIQVGQAVGVVLLAATCTHDCSVPLAVDGLANTTGDINPANNGASTVIVPPSCNEDAEDDGAPGEPNPEEPGDDGNASAPPPTGQDSDDNSSADPANGTGANEDESSAEGNESSPASNETSQPGNESSTPENGPPEAENTSGVIDARVRASSWQDDTRTEVTFRVDALGDNVSQDVTVSSELPAIGRSWFLTGPDAQACTLTARELACWFGDVAPGESKVVTVKAYTDRMACGHHVVVTANVDAARDDQAANDASSAGIEAAPC